MLHKTGANLIRHSKQVSNSSIDNNQYSYQVELFLLISSYECYVTPAKFLFLPPSNIRHEANNYMITSLLFEEKKRKENLRRFNLKINYLINSIYVNNNYQWNYIINVVIV